MAKKQQKHFLMDYFNLSLLLSSQKMYEHLQSKKQETISKSDSAYFAKGSAKIMQNLEDKTDVVYDFGSHPISPVDIFAWFHNTSCYNWNNIFGGTKYILLVEMPLNEKTHYYVNNGNCHEEKKFVNGLVNLIKKHESAKNSESPINVNTLALRSIYYMTKSKPKPIIIGISQRTKTLSDRELTLSRNILQVLYAISDKVDRKVGIVIGNTHTETIKKVISKYSNLEIGMEKEVGKTSFSCPQPNTAEEIEKIPKKEIIESLTKKTDII